MYNNTRSKLVKKTKDIIIEEMKRSGACWYMIRINQGYAFHMAWKGNTSHFYVQKGEPGMFRDEVWFHSYETVQELEPYNKIKHPATVSKTKISGNTEDFQKHLRAWFRREKVRRIGQPGNLVLVIRLEQRIAELQLAHLTQQIKKQIKEQLLIQTDEELEVALQYFTFTRDSTGSPDQQLMLNIPKGTYYITTT